MIESLDFDVIIVGGGHAGCEAAHAAARMGAKTLMVTLDLSRVGVMSCNPAIGGLAKGQLVKEIDAMGGVMGRVTDLTAIQYRQLNASKGPAVRSSRAQCDKKLYALEMQSYLKTVKNLTMKQGEVSELTIENSKVVGIKLNDGATLSSRAVIITSGTFLQAIMHVGDVQSKGGRLGDQSANFLSESLKSLGFRLRRLKTGTPPRLLNSSIDWSRCIPQPGDAKPLPFSFYFTPEKFPHLPQIDCYLTYTNLKTHEIIEKNLLKSPMYSGAITGVGPRYCPSIEDKVKRFHDKDKHQLFLEPEGLDTNEVYINGVSTSLPKEVQEEFIRTVVGLEKVEFLKYGYAVEYDAVDARQLKATYESKDVGGLFFAGQVNGTSGYEEAAGQGLIAGINSALLVQEKDPYIMTRSEGYIGVLADDLVLKGSDEPYRMFTSRAEYRLLLREDNADLRLSEKAYELGLLSEPNYRKFEKKRTQIEKCREGLKSFFLYPKGETNAQLEAMGMPDLKDRVSGEAFLRRPGVDWKVMESFHFPSGEYTHEEQEQVEIQIKYEGYIARDLQLLEGVRKSEAVKIPLNFDFESVSGLSNEIKSRLKITRPESLGQMSRIQGVTPAAVANLMIHLRIKQNERPNSSR